MKKLFITIWILFALNPITIAQTNNRAVHVPLDPNKTEVYDSLFFANDWRIEWFKKSKDWYKTKNIDYDLGEDWMGKMLKVGDKMPDLEMGIVLNNPSGKKKFSDFKGKIVILDFWNTSCSTCIGSFPEMERLQQKFGNQIQIILVNTSQTQSEIEMRMGKNISKIPNLPSIVGAINLIPYFPTSGVPYHVWIDKNGTIRILGSSLNTHEWKIQQLIDNKSIISLNTGTIVPVFIPSFPYSKLVGYKVSPTIYNSFFTAFNYNYTPINPSTAMNQIVASSRNKRNTFINLTVADLYREGLKDRLHTNSKVFVNPFSSGVYEVRDTLMYTEDFLHYSKLNDINYVNNRFCYEQFYPAELSVSNARKMMTEDLNTYFGKLYGANGRIELRSVPGYVIIKLPGEKYKKLFSKSNRYKKTELIKNTKNMVSYRGMDFYDLFVSTVRNEMYTEKKVVINETGIDRNQKIDIELPYNATLTDIKQALKPYGLNVIKRSTEVELLVISDNKAK